MRWRLFLSAGPVVLALWSAASAVTLVQPGEVAVVRRFGRILEDKPGPGLFIGLPWGMDEVERVPVGMVRRVQVGWGMQAVDEEGDAPGGQFLTGDHNLVNVQVEVHYRVIQDEADRFVLNKHQVDGLIARATESALASWIAGRDVDLVWLQGQALLPAALVGRVQQRLEPYALGVQVEQVSVKPPSPPAQVKDAFDKVAQAHTAIDTQRNRALQEADKKERDAEADVFRLSALAAAYAREQHLQAKADAEDFLRRLGQYRKMVKENPEHLNTLWLDEMSRIYARMREEGRVDLLDHFLTSEGLNITQFPLLPRKK